MIEFALRQAADIRWQVLDINKDARARQKLQKPLCLWLTGLPSGRRAQETSYLTDRKMKQPAPATRQ